ncbi:MAG: nickel pincer cofactor biosynthesis protein LarC [Syntrophobacteraceae bacterium]|jgi:uncharacterized protein (TIGR00299 family) protein
MNIAYFDCFSGVSGDMALGALMDLGVPVEALVSGMKQIPVKDWSIETRRERRGAIEGMRVVITAGEQPHRKFSDIEAIFNQSGLGPRVREISLAIFQRLADAEGRVHGVPSQSVHFHEVGAVDSILDIAGVAFCLEYLKIEKIFASPVPLGRGFVRTEHGTMPLPGPATSILLSGVPVYGSAFERELVTPTGAAILATLVQSYGAIPSMTLTATGYGAGADPAGDPPNLLRVWLGHDKPAFVARDLLIIETNIDDMNPEFYNYVSGKLFALGALDVSLVPVQMKKNRPGVLLRVLVEPAMETAAAEMILCETTSLGIRVQEVRRIELPREEKTISTVFGPCRIKCALLPNGSRRLIPEYEECRRIAEETGTPLPDVYDLIVRSAQ